MSFINRLKTSVIRDRKAEEILYASVAKEIDAGIKNNALWLKALERAKGNEERRISEYIKLRIQAIRDDAHVMSQIINQADLAKATYTAQETSSDPLEKESHLNNDMGEDAKDEVPERNIFLVIFATLVAYLLSIDFSVRGEFKNFDYSRMIPILLENTTALYTFLMSSFVITFILPLLYFVSRAVSKSNRNIQKLKNTYFNWARFIIVVSILSLLMQYFKPDDNLSSNDESLELNSLVKSTSESSVINESNEKVIIESVIQPKSEVYIVKKDEVKANDVNTVSAINGDKIINDVCALCHESGMFNSPKLGSKGDWAPRIEKGIDTLYLNAINGYNMMPARGGRPDLSDDDVKQAVDQMLVLVR